MQVIGFDVYGTLVDPAGVAESARTLLGDRADGFVAAWRSRQLEFVFRRAAMGRHLPFDQLTADALEYTASQFGVTLTDGDRERLNEAWYELPAYPDAAQSLAALADAGHRVLALSNATAAGLDRLLTGNGLRDRLHGVLSVDAVEVYKPAPAVYAQLCAAGGVLADATWLISGNAWDVIGARAAGLRGIWIRRAGLPLENWEHRPDRIVSGLDELVADPAFTGKDS